MSHSTTVVDESRRRRLLFTLLANTCDGWRWRRRVETRAAQLMPLQLRRVSSRRLDGQRARGERAGRRVEATTRTCRLPRLRLSSCRRDAVGRCRRLSSASRSPAPRRLLGQLTRRRRRHARASRRLHGGVNQICHTNDAGGRRRELSSSVVVGMATTAAAASHDYTKNVAWASRFLAAASVFAVRRLIGAARPRSPPAAAAATTTTSDVIVVAARFSAPTAVDEQPTSVVATAAECSRFLSRAGSSSDRLAHAPARTCITRAARCRRLAR